MTPSSSLMPVTKQSAPAELPHDILYELFVLCIKTTPNPWFPVVLSQVCHSWRSVALAAPTLWKNVTIHTFPSQQQDHLRSKAFMERSGSLPIGIFFHAGRLQHQDASAIISSHAARLHALVLVSHDRKIAVDFVGHFSQIPFQSLQYFHVFVPGQIEFHVVRGANSAVPMFTPYPTAFNGLSSREFLCFRQLNAQNVTTLVLKGLTFNERPSLRHMWNILHECSGTLQLFDFEGWAPINDFGPLIHPIRLSALRNLRIGYIGDITGLAACIYAPNLHFLTFHDVSYSPTMLPYLEGTSIAQTNLALVFQFLAPSCVKLCQLSLVGLAACARDAVDAFFSTLSELAVLVLNFCHPTFLDALFQPEARYHIPKAIFPKLSRLNLSSAPQTDLARFLLRHKAVEAVLPLERLDITFEQFWAAHGRPGIRSILAVVLEMNSREGLAVYLFQNTPIVAVLPIEH
ncbi:hypothetical protein B0H12DRAFT_1329512 [Mycena haematopus]|nr:hypothetical protein B0H12DRAFT_1329512 [Mycena haematopus]